MGWQLEIASIENHLNTIEKIFSLLTRDQVEVNI